jgi:hypothetical protein
MYDKTKGSIIFSLSKDVNILLTAIHEININIDIGSLVVRT